MSGFGKPWYNVQIMTRREKEPESRTSLPMMGMEHGTPMTTVLPPTRGEVILSLGVVALGSGILYLSGQGQPEGHVEANKFILGSATLIGGVLGLLAHLTRTRIARR